MKSRTSKAIGVVASAAAIALSVPLAVTAYAEPTPPVAEIPDPQGPECGAFKEALPNWKSLANLPGSSALASEHSGVCTACPDHFSITSPAQHSLSPSSRNGLRWLLHATRAVQSPVMLLHRAARLSAQSCHEIAL